MRSAVMALLAALLLIPEGEHQATASRQTITRRFTPDDQRVGRYQYVPFDVPPGATRLDVTYSYDAAGGDNVVDLGLFEPGSLALNTRAFRGYSGGARRSVSIAPDQATPGYRAGPLPAGRWKIHLLVRNGQSEMRLIEDLA